MTKKRKLHPLTGTIKYAWLGTSKSRIYKNQPFYCLDIIQKSLFSKSKETIYAFFNLVDKEVWNTLEQQNFKGKSYRFFCEKRTRGWRLKSWEEVKLNHFMIKKPKPSLKEKRFRSEEILTK